MTYLFAIVAILAFLVWRGRGGRVLKGAGWRAAAAISSIGLIAASAFEGLRGGDVSALVLLLLGLILLGSLRWPRARVAKAASGNGLSLVQARAALGVRAGATAEEIRAAHGRLIRTAHPDRGGAPGLAAQLNAARDLLLKG